MRILVFIVAGELQQIRVMAIKARFSKSTRVCTGILWLTKMLQQKMHRAEWLPCCRFGAYEAVG